jgi:putative ABC transport system permease protein
MFEDFINAIRNFRSNKMRTFLSLLGIIIGVASVIMVTTISHSAFEEVTRSLGSSGLDLIHVRTGWSRGAQNLPLNENFRVELTGKLEGVKEIVYSNEFNGYFLYGNLDLNVQVHAVEREYFTALGTELDYGRYFTATEHFYGLQKIVLGSETVRYLFPEGNALGKVLRLAMNEYQMGFEVVGVLAKAEASPYDNPDQAVYVPRSFYTRKINPGDANASVMLIQAKDQNRTPRIQEELLRIGEEKSGGNRQAIWAFSMQTYVEQSAQAIGIINLLLSTIAGISLLVGGIGIMNIMIVTVTERRREIGIRKALGAGPAAIRTQFLVESATITLTGGVIGIILGICFSAIIVSASNWTLAVQWSNCLAAFAFSVVVGIFFGLHPAIRAAKLDPVEALAGE